MSKYDLDPEGMRLPIKIDTASNGEYCPRPLTKLEAYAKEVAFASATKIARKLNMRRREFLISSAGSAATLLAFNSVHAAAGARGGQSEIPKEAALDPQVAKAALGGSEFIFDVQNHCVDPKSKFRSHPDPAVAELEDFFDNLAPQHVKCEPGSLECYSARQLIKDVLLDSDTTVATVSALYGHGEANPSPPSYASEARELARMIGPKNKRMLMHGTVSPLDPKGNGIASMEQQAKEFGVNAWKLYPQWGPGGTGFYMDDPKSGIPVIERARELNIKIICAHRGLPLQGYDYKYSLPRDMGPVARMYPDVSFVAYHSGCDLSKPEGPYNPADVDGVNGFITSFLKNGQTRNKSNLYGDLGSTWRERWKSGPDQAAHLLGKLFKYLGENQICWGTDCLWYGSPQDQIQAFRTFQISKEFQDKYGYPAITSEMRAKVLGLNSARIYGLNPTEIMKKAQADAIGQMRQAYLEEPNPAFRSYGPKTRREFLAQWRARGSRPDG
jgi:predicted TIM-barrel fold metal-dependent hydrolase